MSPEATPTRRTCAHMIVHELLVETKPEYRARRLAAEEQTVGSIQSGEAMKVVDKLIKIPVVVHVVHRTAAENVSKAQVEGQIRVLNHDFRLARIVHEMAAAPVVGAAEPSA